jgi:hypothetical protein
MIVKLVIILFFVFCAGCGLLKEDKTLGYPHQIEDIEEPHEKDRPAQEAL